MMVNVRSRLQVRRLLLMALMAFLPMPAWAGEAPVGELGDAGIFLATGAEDRTQEAARDLAGYIERMTGATLRVTPVDGPAAIPADRWAFVLGDLAVAAGLKPPETESRTDGFAIEVVGRQVRLAGEGDIGTYFAVAHFLEMQGVRWYTPGPYGEIVPERKTLLLPDAPIRETPDLAMRNVWYHGGSPGATPEHRAEFDLWARRNKAGGLDIALGHMWSSVFREAGGAEALARQHPDWFHKTRGQPDPKELCIAQPAVVDLFMAYYRRQLEGRPRDVRETLSICPDDGVFRFDCPRCREFIYRQDPIVPSLPDASDLMVRFCNQVAQKLCADYPNVRLGLYVYSNYEFAPEREPVHPNVIGFFAPLNFDRYHQIGDPRSPSRMLLGDAIERWAKGSPTFGLRDYSFLCPDVMMPFTQIHMVSHDFPWLFARGLRYWSVETAKNWPNMMPAYYLAVRLAWSMKLDQTRLLDEYYTSYFGPAGPAMRAYQDEVVRAYENVPFSAGNKEFMNVVFPPERLAKLRALLNQAKQAVAEDAARTHRVGLYEFPQRQAEMFMAMRDSINRCDFSSALELSRRIYDTFTESIAFDPLTNNCFARDSWYRPFYLEPLETIDGWTQGAAIVHRFPDEWPAYLDGQDVPGGGLAQRAGILEAKTPLFDFLKLKTYSACLAEQGLERFRGALWYRERFRMPRVPEGQRLYLLLAGVDDTVAAWLNGTCLGTRQPGHFGPALFEIPTAGVGPDKECLLTVRVTNREVTELGVGGILRPACLLAGHLTP